MRKMERLHEAISAVCPIDGVSLDRIGFREIATLEQRAAAQVVLANFDHSEAAHAAWLEDRQPERKAIRQQVVQAVADNTTFLAIASPSNAQTLAQVRRLTQQTTAIIKRLAQLD